MISILRLVVCGGLFAFGYYLGRKSSRLESLQDQTDAFENSGSASEPDKMNPGQ